VLVSKEVQIVAKNIRQDVQGFTFRVSAPSFSPFVKLTESEIRTSEVNHVDGLEARLLRCVSQTMNLSIVVKKHLEAIPYVQKLEDGTWNWMFGDLLYNRSEASIGGCFGYVIRDVYLYISVTYFADKFTLFLPLAEQFLS
jgi:hypothetical protein